MADPIAFMVMPFDTKSTGKREEGVPTQVDFDALWYRVYEPVLRKLGYKPVRADTDVGALIISEMIQRLALSDLVVADVTLPNANVYYEVGVRHAAKAVGCVLVAADWAKPVFDLAQMRQLRFPLVDGAIGDAEVKAARAVLTADLSRLTSGSSPVFDAVPGYPGEVELSRVSAFRDTVAELSDFDADVRATRAAPVEERPSRALAVLERHGHKPVVREAVVLQLIRLLRDYVSWQAVLDYIRNLPPSIADHPLVVEQHCLALGKTGNPVDAAAKLEQLIHDEGETPERLGLLGGRYKELYRRAKSRTDVERYRDLAIKHYERGMLLDYNEYYCAANLPRLYRARAADHDEARAAAAATIAYLACDRAITLGTADEWVKPTLLGAAYDRADAAGARQLLDEVKREGSDAWKLETTLNDLRESVALQQDNAARAELEQVLSDLRQLLPAS